MIFRYFNHFRIFCSTYNCKDIFSFKSINNQNNHNVFVILASRRSSEWPCGLQGVLGGPWGVPVWSRRGQRGQFGFPFGSLKSLKCFLGRPRAPIGRSIAHPSTKHRPIHRQITKNKNTNKQFYIYMCGSWWLWPPPPHTHPMVRVSRPPCPRHLDQTR